MSRKHVWWFLATFALVVLLGLALVYVTREPQGINMMLYDLPAKGP